MADYQSQTGREIIVRIWGMNANGHAFFQNVTARNLTSKGASLSGLEHALKLEEVLGLSYGEHKSRIRVVRLGGAVLPGKIEVEVEVVGSQPCPWAAQLEALETTPASHHPAHLADRNKRRFPRVKTPFPIEIRDARGGGTAMQTRAADVSGRGCYVESLVPLPLGTRLSITFWIGQEKILTSGMIRSSDPGVGMGIEFTALDDETKVRLQKHLEQMAKGFAG
jgi:hypothetical protein